MAVALIIVILILFSLLYLLWKRVQKFSFVVKAAKGNRKAARLLSLIPVFLFVLAGVLDFMNAATVLLYLMFFLGISELIYLFIRKRRDLLGVLAVFVTVVFFIAAAFLAYTVKETKYELTTEKPVGKLRIVQISDAHLGTLFSGNGFSEILGDIQKTEPDLFVITGDFVDDETKKEDMLLAVKALSEFRAAYGVYYVFGNHDRGYQNHRDFSEEDLLRAFSDAGIFVLRDECVSLNDSLLLCGRNDGRTRMEMKELLPADAEEKYTVVLDHHPTDYEAQKAANVDLVLSGHTHGGQFLLLRAIMEIFHINDQVYGHTHGGNTDFIVSSGIADWALRFRTGPSSEYVVIDISETAAPSLK